MLLRRSLSLLVVVISLGLPTAGLRAAPAADAASFVNNLVSEGLQTLANKQLTPQAREQRFNQLLRQGFDIPRISRFVLGRYWRTASEQERQAFTDVFEQWVIRTYGQRFNEYSGDQVQVKITGQRPEGSTSFVVSSEVIRPNGAPPARVDWRVRKEGDDYKIVDVDVEGVSMALTQREEFASVIQRNGGSVAGLTKALKQKLASGATDRATLPRGR